MSQAAKHISTDNLDIEQIIKILPHRYPFLLVDRITSIDVEEKKITGIKNVSINEPYFQGHFPEKPIMPGVLILEAIAQVGVVLLEKKSGLKDKIAFLMNIKEAKFRRPIVPGDQMQIEVQGLFFSENGGKIQGKVLVDGNVAAQAIIGFVLAEK